MDSVNLKAITKVSIIKSPSQIKYYIDLKNDIRSWYFKKYSAILQKKIAYLIIINFSI